jgi:integrase
LYRLERLELICLSSFWGPPQYSATPSGKSSKGTVQVISSHGRLQLRFRFVGKRHCLSLGFPDTAVNRKLAEMRAREIELDMVSGNFDPTLTKYKPHVALAIASPDLTPKITPKVSLAVLWASFVEYKRPQCSENTMYYVYQHFTTYMEKLPTHDLSKAGEIRDFSVQTFPLESCKRFIVRLSACCEWAKKSRLIEENPFAGMAKEIKPPKSQRKTDEEDINPFSIEERDRILTAISADTFCNKHSGFKHSFYASYVEFMFMTGCRPSEAIALQWRHISKDFKIISFEQAVIETGKGRKLREGLKTQERRRFPCNQKLQALLQSIKPANATSDTLVFPGYTGGYLDTKSFRKSIWKLVLTGLAIEYRKPYQTRHTFITLALDSMYGGLDVKDVARLVGNSPEVIYRHYAGNKRDLFVPEF